MPNSMVNEIHGAWFDPSNPVVPMKGSLRSDLFQWMLDWEQLSDLVLAVGTSMSGMNADRIPVSCASRFANGKGFGMVIVSIQQTQQDRHSSLRIFAKIDDVFKILMDKLAIDIPTYVKTNPVDTSKLRADQI